MDVRENIALLKSSGIKVYRLPSDEEYAAMEQDPSTEDLNFFTVESYSAADDTLVLRETDEPTFLMQSNFKLPDDVGTVKLPSRPGHFFKVTDQTPCKEISKNSSVFVGSDRDCSDDGFYLVFSGRAELSLLLKTLSRQTRRTLHRQSRRSTSILILFNRRIKA